MAQYTHFLSAAKFRLALKLTLVTVGFLLFVLMSGFAYTQLDDRKPVEGEPQLLPHRGLAVNDPMKGKDLGSQTQLIMITQPFHYPGTPPARNSHSANNSNSGAAELNPLTPAQALVPASFTGETPGVSQVGLNRMPATKQAKLKTPGRP